MKQTVETIVKALVDEPDQVEIQERDQNGTILIEIRVAQPDMGKIIGKQGRTIRALRSLAHAVGLKKRRRFVLDIVE